MTTVQYSGQDAPLVARKGPSRALETNVHKKEEKKSQAFILTCGSSGSGEHMSACRESRAVLMVRAGDHWSFKMSCDAMCHDGDE